MNNIYVSKALLEFIESDFKTIKECLNAAEELNMKQLFSEGDESIQDVMNNQAEVDNPDDGKHDQDNGATGDRFNDFMDQIPQMNPSDSENFDSDSEEPVYNEDGNSDDGEDYHNDLMSDAAPEGDPDNLMGGNGFDSMPMTDMMGGMMPQQPPMMMPQMGMPMQPMMMPQMGMPMQPPMMQPVQVAQPVAMPMYGQPMPQVQPFAQMQPGVMQAQMPNNTPYAGGISQEVPPSDDPNTTPPPTEDPNGAPPSDPNAETNQQPPEDPNQPVDSIENIPDETGAPNDWDTPEGQNSDNSNSAPPPEGDPNAATPAEDPNTQASPDQDAQPMPTEDPNALPQEDPTAASQTDPNSDPNAIDPNMQDMAGMPDDPTAAMQGGDPNDPNAMPQDPNMPMDPNDPNAQMDPNADPNAMPGDPTQQQGPDENQRLSHNIDQLNKLETQVSNLSEKINNEKIDKLKKSINQLINGVTDNMTNLRDKPELPKLNDMIEKFLNNCIDELNGVVDKEKSKQNQQEDQDNQFRKNDEVNPNDMPDQQADNQTVQQPVQKGY